MQGFRLGSLFGFELRIDLCWFSIFLVILWSLTGGLFSANYPELDSATYFGIGTGTLLFFVSLIAHELSHSLVAKAKGIPIEGITLFACSDVLRTRMEAESPSDEFQIAIIRPLTGVVLAALFGIIWCIGTNVGTSVVFTAVASSLAFINLIFAIINLLPGFPLNGGRVFRSIVWKFTGDIIKATKIAATCEKWLGYLLIGLGICQAFGDAFVCGLWTILFGFFLHNSTEMSYQNLLIRSNLKGVRVRDIMTPYPKTVSPELTLQELVKEYFLTNRGYQSFLVVASDSRPIGIISLKQVKAIPRLEWAYYNVKDTMIPIQNEVTVHPQEHMSHVLDKMQELELRLVLITENGSIQGIITANDVAYWLQRQQDLGLTARTLYRSC